MRHNRIRHFVGVFDAPMVRVYSRIGSSPQILGRSGTGRKAIGVGLWSYEETTRAVLETRSGISAVTMTEWFLRSAFAANPVFAAA